MSESKPREWRFYVDDMIRCAVANDYRDKESADSRLSGHRQRHFVEHHPDRYSGTDSAAGTNPVPLTGGMPGIFQQDTD